MKLKLSLIVTLVIVQISWTQKCDFKIREISSTIIGSSELIQKSEYDSIISEKFIDFTPISKQQVIHKYPKIFKRVDSCLTYNSKIKENKICKNRIQSREYSDYKVIGSYSGNIVVEFQEYEGWGFISIDKKNGASFFSLGKPLTSNGKTAISYSNYYGEEEIALTNLKTKQQYVIVIDNWSTIESKTYKNTYYLKLQSTFCSNNRKEFNYLKIKLNTKTSTD